MQFDFGWNLTGKGKTGFKSWQRQGRDSFLRQSVLTSSEVQLSPIQCIRGVLSLTVKRSDRKADNTPPSSTRLIILGAILPFSHTISWRCTYLSTVVTSSLLLQWNDWVWKYRPWLITFIVICLFVHNPNQYEFIFFSCPYSF
jgi:hypothetical protein